jgi:UDP-glucuronate 4-epimerase
MASNGKRVLVTGSAGFIGFHTCSKLLQQGATVLGVDNFSAYYDVALKEARTDILGNHADSRSPASRSRMWTRSAPPGPTSSPTP